MEHLILHSHTSVHLQYYIIDPDSTGEVILQACKEAAQRGVKVMFVADAFGSDKLTRVHIEDLNSAGVNFRYFKPVFSSGEFYVGRRMHHKILVVDEKISVVGGMNIADRYPGTDGALPWIDYAVSVSGNVSRDLARYCEKIFYRSSITGKGQFNNPFRPFRNLDRSATWVRMRINDSLRGRREVSNSYNRATRRARRSITIVGGYFLPGARYRRNLIYASRNGVEIRVILTRNTDVKLVKLASDYLYRFLLRNGIRVFESNERMVHGKVAVVDDTFVTIGSYNQNNLSALLSLEANIDIVDEKFATSFRSHFDELIREECTEVTIEKFLNRSTFGKQFLRWLSYKMLRVSLRILLLMNRVLSPKE
jgi:cardiolipin synthase